MTTRPVPAEDATAEVPAAIQRRTSVAYKSGEPISSTRAVPEETAIALTYDGATQAVMMATPLDLEDFAVGFSLTERIVASKDDIQSLDVVPLEEGVELRMWLKKPIGEALASRRRHLAGPTGCGLCGVDSLSEAVRAPTKVGDTFRIDAADISTALDTLPAAQIAQPRNARRSRSGLLAPRGRACRGARRRRPPQRARQAGWRAWRGAPKADRMACCF